MPMGINEQDWHKTGAIPRGAIKATKMSDIQMKDVIYSCHYIILTQT